MKYSNAVIKDIKAREVIAAEFLRFFIPETPKYRSINNTTEVISKKVGLNREDGTYAGEIKTFGDALDADANILQKTQT